MGFDLEVASEVGGGSTFRIVMGSAGGLAAAAPASSRLPPAAEAAVRHRPTAAAEATTVLVIDDDPDSRDLIVQAFEELGCRVLAAGSGKEGLRMAWEHRPALISLDLMMPEMDGWRTLEALKARPVLRDIPVVIVSVVANENRGSLLGAVDILQKPVDPKELRRVLERTLGSSEGPVLVVEDDQDTQRLLRTYLGEEGYTCRTAGNGCEALQALESFEPALILLDLMMPVMDGMTFLAEIRLDERFAHLPVVVISAKELTGEERMMLAATTESVLEKGDALDGCLKAAVRQALGRRAAAGSLSEALADQR